jgi:alkylhydroperoxidase/carboxymuconolactone decarboxylase family protein YurZ
MRADARKSEKRLQEIAEGDLSAVDALLLMHEGAYVAAGLDAKTFQLVQVAALVAVDASPTSWLLHLSVANETDAPVDKLFGTLLAVAPIVGTPRVVSAAANIIAVAGLTEELAGNGH